jgi:hypothetical protein
MFCTCELHDKHKNDLLSESLDFSNAPVVSWAEASLRMHGSASPQHLWVRGCHHTFLMPIIQCVYLEFFVPLSALVLLISQYDVVRAQGTAAVFCFTNCDGDADASRISYGERKS